MQLALSRMGEGPAAGMARGSERQGCKRAQSSACPDPITPMSVQGAQGEGVPSPLGRCGGHRGSRRGDAK